MSPSKINRYGEPEETLEEKVIHAIEQEFKKTHNVKLLEELFKTSVSVIAVISFLWFIGEPHLARYVDNRIQQVSPASEEEIRKLKEEIARITTETEANKKLVVDVLDRLDVISQNTRNFRIYLQQIMKNYPPPPEEEENRILVKPRR